MIRVKTKITDKGGKNFKAKVKALAQQGAQEHAVKLMLAELAKITCPTHGPLVFEDKGLDTNVEACCELTQAEFDDITNP